MSLRTKLVLALVVCTSLASAAVGLLSYRSTEQRLVAEVDDSLRTAVRVLTAEADRRGPGALRALAAPGDVEIQLVTPDGQTRSRAEVEDIPVSDGDLEVASADLQGVQLWRDDRQGDVPVRMLTQSIGSGSGAVQAVRSLEETERVLSALRVRILVVALAVSAVSGAAGWVIARQVTGRLVSVTDAAERVASTGALDVEVPVAGADEAARLGGAFNEMMAALSRSREDQQRLVQDAGHELRTPMTSLRTNLYNLRSFDSMDEASREGVLADLTSETEELSRLIDEVVEVATDRRGDEPLVEVDMEELAGRVAQRAAVHWDRDVRVRVSGRPVLLGRREALSRAVRNLVENACKFDPSGGAVDVVVRAMPGGDDPPVDPPTGAAVQVEVLDNGPGIAEADLAHVFERFYRSEGARAAPGSGLGLSIVSEVVQAHGGICWAANRPEGGAAVCFRIPVDPVQAH